MMAPRNKIYTIFLILTVLMFSSACSLLPKQTEETDKWSASKFYSEAKSALAATDYEDAIKYYEMLLARYPFGRFAQQAQVELIYTYYKYDEPESALAGADRFIKTHPRHPNIDYVYYLKGLVNFNRGKDLISRYLPQDPTQRDPGATRQAFDDFSVLTKKFPQSKYSRDARQRMLFLRNNLAQYEVHVANYYMKRGAYIAAANRSKYVLEHYQKTPAIPGALEVMIRAYERLGLDDLATDARRVMQTNYPDYQTAQKSN